MDINVAKQAAALAAEIDAITAVMSQLQSAIDGNWQIANLTLRVFNPENGYQNDIPLGTLDAAASLAALTLAKGTYQAQIDAANQQLAALA